MWLVFAWEGTVILRLRVPLILAAFLLLAQTGINTPNILIAPTLPKLDWSRDGVLSTDAFALLEVLAKAPEEGLVSDDYNYGQMRQLMLPLMSYQAGTARLDPETLIRLDALMTQAFYRYAQDMAEGRLRPDTLKRRETIDNPALLQKALNEKTVSETLLGLSPKHLGYRALKKELARLRHLDGLGAQPTGPSENQVVLNMERWRWLPNDLGKKHIIVNIADYSLEYFEEGQSVLRMRVAVGRPYRQTPVFSSPLQAIVLNPSWHVPLRILTQDLMPKVKKDPGFLKKQKIHVLGPNRWVQEPGNLNAMGRIEFVLPNPYDVYLHDTPAGHVFEQEGRAVSSGCIRLEKPFELAMQVMKPDPNWTIKKMFTLLEDKKRKNIVVKEPVMVHLLYWTTQVDSEGRVRYLQDIYGRDKALMDVLTQDAKGRWDSLYASHKGAK